MKERTAMKKRRGKDATVMSEDARAPPHNEVGHALTPRESCHPAHPGHPNEHESVRARSSKLVKRPYERGHRQRSTAFEPTKYGHQLGNGSLT